MHMLIPGSRFTLTSFLSDVVSYKRMVRLPVLSIKKVPVPISRFGLGVAKTTTSSLDGLV